MDIVPQITEKMRYPWVIEVFSYLRDHRFDGKVILPAVEILIALANAVKLHFRQMGISYMLRASFSRFLFIGPETERLEVFIDIENAGHKNVTAALLTSMKLEKRGMSRLLEHARVQFAAEDSSPCPETPFQDVEKLGGECISVPAATIYRDLVPFGKAYQNIIGDLKTSPEGAMAYLSGGDDEADENLLGSPFPFDAAMQAASVWGQRYTGIVPFPIGFEKRSIYRKTRKGSSYLGRVSPVNIDRKSLTFDAWIYDLNGVIYEVISGIKMRDITQGRAHPPQWIQA